MRRALDRAGMVATLLLPLALLHGRSIADGLIVLLGVMFLGRSAVLRDWAWLRVGWVRVALLWWGWLVLCSVWWREEVFQAVSVVRFLLLAAALEHWVLGDAALRGWLIRLLRWSAFYLAAECLLQFAIGHNSWGWPRGADGELTGPYKNPRAGSPLSRLLFPAVLPLAHTPVRGLLWLLGGTVLMILIGQRMPLLLTFLGLFVSALFLPRLRGAVLFATVACGILLAALPAVSPQAAHRLESEFGRQMSDFSANHYGLIVARSLAIVRDRPVRGAGFDGFRRLCDDPRYFQGWHGGDGGGAEICVQHPHSFYLQALVESGVPGLVLFAALACTWLWTIGRGLWTRPEPLRVGLFVAALLQLWPIASSTDWVAMPLAGWFFLQLGLALAEARAYMRGLRISIEA